MSAHAVVPEPIVRYAPEQIESELRNSLATLARALDEPDVRDLVGEVPIADLRAELRRLEQHLDDDFRIVLIGHFKRGKSTLINALLGAEVAPMDALPETVTINELRWGETAAQCIRLVDGGTVELDQEELCRDRIEPLLDRYGPRVSHLEIVRSLKSLEGVVWVDTPGTGDLDDRFESAVAAYLSKADLVIVLVSATAPLSASELAFLRRAVAPQEFGKLYLIVNRIDEIRRPEDVERLRRLVEQTVAQEFPGAQVVALSALDELRRVTGGDRLAAPRAAEFEAAFAAFSAGISETIRTQREALHLDRGLLAARRLTGQFQQRVQLLREGLDADAARVDAALAAYSSDVSALEERFARHRQEIENRLASCRQQTTAWMEGFAERLLRELPRTLGGLEPAVIDRHLPFFVAERLRAALEACVQTQAGEFAAVAARTLADWQHELAVLVDAEGVGLASAQATTSVPTLDGVAIADLVLERLILGGGLIIDLVGRSLGRREGSDVAERVEALRANLPSLLAALGELIERNYGALAHRLAHRLTETYAAQRQAVLATLERARQLQEGSAARHGERVAQAERLLARCGETAATVETLRAKLGGAGGKGPCRLSV